MHLSDICGCPNCGAAMNGSDHCPCCGCEEYETTCVSTCADKGNPDADHWSCIDQHLARLDGIHGAPPDDPAEDPRHLDHYYRPRFCDSCGGLAPISNDDSSHDDCFDNEETN